MRELYAGLGEPSTHAAGPHSRSVGDPALMPAAWRSADAEYQAMWRDVTNPYCMGCHRINGLDYSVFGAFSGMRRKVNGKSRLLAYLADDNRVPRPSSDEPAILPYMPLAELPYLILQRDVTAQRAIAAWTR